MMSGIFDMFGPSPIKPIEQHMRKVYHCAELLHPLFTAALQKDWKTVQAINEQIEQEEKEADLMKRHLRLHLPTGLFLPVARTDVLELLTAQDKIANKAEDIAGLVASRKMLLPENVAVLFIPFLSRCLEAAKQACKAIDELDDLLESGFRGSEVKIVEEMIVTLDDIEHDTDEQQAQICEEIFKLEQKLPAIDIFFLYKLVDWIGDLADHAHIVGGRLQILIAR